MCSIVKFPNKKDASTARVQAFKDDLREVVMNAIVEATNQADTYELKGVGAAVLLTTAEHIAQIAYILGADKEELAHQFLDAHRISIKHFEELMK